MIVFTLGPSSLCWARTLCLGAILMSSAGPQHPGEHLVCGRAGAGYMSPFTPRWMASGRGRSGAIKRGALARRGRAPWKAISCPGKKGSRGMAGSGQGIRMGLRAGVGGTQGTRSWSRARFYELTFSLYMTPGSARGDHLWSPSSEGNRRSVSQLQGCGHARNPPTPLWGPLSWSALCSLRSINWHTAVSLLTPPCAVCTTANTPALAPRMGINSFETCSQLVSIHPVLSSHF